MDRYTDFIVFSDTNAVGNHFVPSGWMGDIQDIMFNDHETQVFHAGGTAIRITYQPTGSNKWAGIYWQYPQNNWGTQAGVGFNLTGVTLLTF